MSGLWFLMIVLVCPLMMIFMMRGMHGGGHDSTTDTQHDRGRLPEQPDPRDARLADLEREVAALRAADKGPDRDDVHTSRR